MPRLEPPTREALLPADQAIWDEIVGSRGRVIGPYLPLMKVPALAQRVAALGEQLRFHSLLPAADRELAILATGREVGAKFEWAAHEPIARREGTRSEATRSRSEPGSARCPERPRTIDHHRRPLALPGPRPLRYAIRPGD